LTTTPNETQQTEPGPLDSNRFVPERFLSPAYLGVLDNTVSNISLRIAEAALAELRELAEAGYPHEICGLLVGRLNEDHWHIEQIRAVANLNQERAADRFQLDPAAYQAIERKLRGSGNEIVGVYHSHPDCPAKPSPTDLESAWEGFAYPIVSVCEGKAANIRCWCINEAGKQFQSVHIEGLA